MRNKIIHVIDNIDAGGAQEIVYSLCKYMKDAESTVVVLAGKGNYYEKLSPYADKIIILSKNRYNLLPILIKLFLIIRKNKDGIFNGHLQFSCFLLSVFRMCMNFNLVLSLHAIPQQLPYWYNKIFPVIFKAQHYVVADMIQYEYLLSHNIKKDKISYIPIGTEKVQDVKKAETNIKEELKIPANAVVILNIARMIKAKGQKELLYMMDKLAKSRPELPFHLLIVGSGPEEEALRCLAAELGIWERITFAGRRTDLHNFYSCADWFVMSCSDENMGVVIYEALAYRIPVIAYNCGSVAEVIDSDQKGFLVNPQCANLAKILLEKYPPSKTSLCDSDLCKLTAARMSEDYEKCYLRLM
ncbi:MAG: glycosyltransferase [Planctomycetes bacterium]|nr:glycosyltransferase [Planctomycetota bacterium]